MTKEQAKVQAKLECLENTTSPKPCDCECIECDLEYRQGNMGEQKQALDMAINALEQQPSDDVMAIHTQGLAEGIRCAMCTNSMKSDSGCDGGCIIDNAMYKKVMDTINNQMFSQPTSDDCVSLGVYKQVTWERDIAIEQLKELGYGLGEKIRTSEDCVSREAMLNAITEIDNNVNMDIYTNEVREIVNELPPVTPTHRWNLISEYEPPRDSQLMFCDNQGSVFISRVIYQGEYFSYVGEHGCYKNKAGENTGNIIAWAELPKPYKEKRGNKNDI